MAGTAAIKVGLIGSGIGQSSSPALHEAEAAALGLDYSYRLFDLDHTPGDAATLAALLDRLAAEGFAGCNITHPVKQTVIPLLDRLSPEARTMGAVNTVRFVADGTREGHNTDWWGFGENLRRTLPAVAMRNVVLLGAGGAGAAAGYALGRLGAAHLTVVDSDLARSRDLADKLGGTAMAITARGAAEIGPALAEADGLVQATPIGMAKYPGMPIDPRHLRPELWIAEIIYVPVETELLLRARALGCRTASGVGMVVLQAARALEIFTGAQPDADRMLRSFQTLVAA